MYFMFYLVPFHVTEDFGKEGYKELILREKERELTHVNKPKLETSKCISPVYKQVFMLVSSLVRKRTSLHLCNSKKVIAKI